MGIEPTSEAWEASILPLYDARSVTKVSKTPLEPQEGMSSRHSFDLIPGHNCTPAQQEKSHGSAKNYPLAISQRPPRDFLTAERASVSVKW